jgi:hypothetical protein
LAVTKKQLENIVGKGNVLDDEPSLKQYAVDQSFVASHRPDLVAFVTTGKQVQKIVRLANETDTPLIPFSSGKNLHGATIPDHGGVIVNMSRMKKIIKIDEENWFAIVEPGVTYQELQDTLMKKGFHVMVPYGVPPDRSVLTSYLERDPVMAAPSFEYGNALIMDTEVVLPSGEIFLTGNWSSGGEPGAPYGPIRSIIYRLWTGAQGTLGILTKMGVQINPIPKTSKIFFIPFDSLSQALEPLKRIQRREIGMECFLLNNFNMAAMFTDDWEIPQDFPTEPIATSEFEELRKELPPWILTLCIHGSARHPEDKIAYEEEALREICSGLNINVLETLPNIGGASHIMLAEILCPWRILKKFRYKGSVHDLTFKASMHKVAILEQTLQGLSDHHGYSASDIGIYLLPLERGRAMHCEFDLHCSPADKEEWDKVKELWVQASATLMNNSAYFDRPYGAWAEMVYSRSTNYTIKLKQIKKELDANNIMNPGKLCFSC